MAAALNETPRIRMRRRPNDFRSRGPVFFQMGTTCCCCCLHWAGALVGSCLGVIATTRALEEREGESEIDPRARSAVIRGTSLGLIWMFIIIIGVTMAAFAVRGGGGIIEGIVALLAIVPALGTLPICAAALIAAGGELLTRSPDKPGGPSGFPLAWRISGFVVIWSFTCAAVGYLIMLLLTVIGPDAFTI